MARKVKRQKGSITSGGRGPPSFLCHPHSGDKGSIHAWSMAAVKSMIMAARKEFYSQGGPGYRCQDWGRNWKSQMSNTSRVTALQVKQTYHFAPALIPSGTVGARNGINLQGKAGGIQVKGQGYGRLQHHKSVDKGRQNHETGSSLGEQVEQNPQIPPSFTFSGGVGSRQGFSHSTKGHGGVCQARSQLCGKYAESGTVTI